MKFVVAILLCVFASLREVSAQEPWATYRGNSQRTGNTDGKAGPKKGEVLWVQKTLDHFIAAPVPVGDRLFVSGISGFNVPGVYLLETAADAKKRVAWNKTAPVLRLPTVSSPAISGGKLVFGDGMHQTDGAFLNCVSTDTGRTLWQLPVPGTLVHLEGSPTIAGGKVYLGGGNAGVLCVDLEKVTLEGKAVALDDVKKLQDKKWAELVAKYEEEKKKDEFAVPPSEDQLPKAEPVKLWQQGEKKWHVDAPVAVVGDRVLTATAFLDKEMTGLRALVCLDAKTGETKWTAKLTFNPWGGAAVKGNRVAIGCASIGYEVNDLKKAKGEIAVFDLEKGTEVWRKAVPAGILGNVVIVEDRVICTATDGQVRTFDLATGERGWRYEGKTPIFAPPAVAGDVVYVADLKGVVTALSLMDGSKPLWTVDLGEHPAVKSPGMVYGGPVVHGGKLYVATCNLAGAFVNRPTAVVCIGEK